MRTIWKWSLALTDHQTLRMPAGALVRAVQLQREQPVLWAECDPGAETEPREFAIYGTGHRIPDNPGVYCGTFQSPRGDVVFHVYEVAE